MATGRRYQSFVYLLRGFTRPGQPIEIGRDLTTRSCHLYQSWDERRREWTCLQVKKHKAGPRRQMLDKGKRAPFPPHIPLSLVSLHLPSSTCLPSTPSNPTHSPHLSR